MPDGITARKRVSSDLGYSILYETWASQVKFRTNAYTTTAHQPTLCWSTNRDSIQLHDPASHPQTPFCQVKR